MSANLPVNMIPLVGRAVKSGGFVIAVLIGLALFAAYKTKDQKEKI